jgi:hypothetical protein
MQPGSGLSIAAYCREQRISQPSFFAWKRRLNNGVDSGFVEVTAASPERSFAGDTIEICLRGDRRLLVRRGFDRELLSELVTVLEGLA